MRSRSIFQSGLLAGLLVAVASASPACGKKRDHDQSTSASEPSAKLRQPRPGASKESATTDAKFLVRISLTRGSTGPHAKATQIHVSIIDDKLYYIETPYDGPGTTPVAGARTNVVAHLTDSEQRAIAQSLRDLSLFDVETLQAPKMPDGPHSYVSMDVKLRAGGKEHEFALSGATSLPPQGETAFATTAGYRGVMRLVDDLSALAKEKRASAGAPAPVAPK